MSPAARIDDFRQMIWQETRIPFEPAGIRSHHLTLWKVSIPLTEMAAKLPDVRHLEAMDGIQRLDPDQTISGHMRAFEGPPIEDRLHVIAQPPIPSESPSASSRSTTLNLSTRSAHMATVLLQPREGCLDYCPS
jgi:hypothetical protein